VPTGDPATLDALFYAETTLMLANRPGVDPGSLRPDVLQASSREENVSRIVREMRAAGVIGSEIDEAWISRYMAGFNSRMGAAIAYRPVPYPGEIVLLRATRSPEDLLLAPPDLRRQMEDPGLGWDGLASLGVRAIPVPGSHHTMLREPHVGALAEALRACLLLGEEEGTGEGRGEGLAILV